MTMSPPSPSPAEVPQWLKSLPLAPEYHPSPAEFQDPIAYILKIEREASSFGICKIVPPLPAPPRKSCVSHLARSFPRRTFTTRQQHLGLCPRRPRPVQKPVWQSGEDYTLPRFEAKARNFERSVLRRAPCAELDIEALFWKAAADRPVVVEYANDIPGSGFAPPRPRGSLRWKEEDVGDTAWNMRRVSREKGSLLRFMREEIPGVTSPMVYVAMLFSWFAWHVEDHELHSLNYLHMGASKTWYGVPRDARFAFEEVVRVQGYGGDVNPLVTFALLGEKTTVMSPEVLLGAGIPCCRLVQNAGDFVVTFPGSYHCGFSHGYNCGEASNIATPEWLKVAKEAAIRRASINVPPMVSHYQLLFELAMSLWSRKTLSGAPEPRSSRLKDKLRGEGEVMIKELFVQSIMENNNLLYTLLDNGSSCVVLPQSGYGGPFNSSSQSRTQMKIKTKPSIFSCDREETQEDSREEPSPEPILDSDASHGLRNHSLSAKKHPSVGSTESCTSSDSENMHQEKEKAMNGEGLLDQGLLSCVTCGILSYACVAIVQPTERAAVFLMSANSGTFLDQLVTTSEVCYGNKDTYLKSGCAQTGISDFSNNNCEAFGDNLGHSHDHQVDAVDHKAEPTFVSAAHDGPSALDLLASAYGNLSSDTDEDNVEYEEKSLSGDVIKKELSPLKTHNGIQDFMPTGPLSSLPPTHTSHPPEDLSNNLGAWENSSGNCSFHTDLMESKSPGGFTTDVSPGQSSNDNWIEDDVDQYHSDMNSKQLKSVSPDVCFKMKVMPTMHQPEIEAMPNAYLMNLNATLMQPRPDKDSSRLHVFCLEHALEVQRLLSPFGGVNIMLLCHPDYQIIESQAKLASTELRINYTWKDINFREATGQDRERIKSALDDEEAIPMSSDWAVKMGMNLYYSASLSKSPLYSKQIPYNRVIYKAFGRNSSGNLPGQLKVFERRRGKKSVVAGRWCGKVWMSNQVHPYVTRKTGAEEQNCATTNDPEVENVNDRETNNTDAKLMKPPSVDALDAYSPCAKTSSRKRKKTVEKVNAKKPRHNQQHCYESPEHSAGNSSGQGKMVRRSARTNGTSTALRNESIKAPQHHDSSLDGDLECGPKTRLRSRPLSKGPKTKKTTEEKPMAKKKKQGSAKRSVENDDLKEYPCDIEGCTMSFSLKQDLALHKRNICPVKGCGKKFFSHKYLVQHRRVHTDDRPLKCPWKGCKMSFKWAWARTEHIRVHTGDRPYICMVGGCGQTFRFVSDFSRHKRKTGHISKKVRR